MCQLMQVYFYWGVKYNLAVVYLELTLTRIIVSWVVALVVCILFPSFVLLTHEEKLRTFSPVNVSCKVLGAVFILTALVQLQ